MWQLKKVGLCIGLIILIELVELILKLKEPNAPYFHFFSNLLACYQLLILLFCIFSIITDELIFKRFFRNSYKIFSLALFLGLFIACESICVYLVFHPESISKGLATFRRYYREFDMNLIQFNKNYSEYNDSLFYTLKKEKKFVYTNPEFSNSFITNSQGLRDDETSLEAPSIIFLGDSYTLGWGVEQEDTYVLVVERLTGLKALNTGVSSYGTARESMVLSAIDISDAEFIIWQYCYNDAIENKTYVDNNFRLPVRSQREYDDRVRETNWNTKYFPGKYSLTMLNLFKQGFARKPRNISAEKSKLDEDARQEAERFLAIVENSKIDWNQTKVIVIELNHKESASKFIPALHNLVERDKKKKQILTNMVVADVKTILDPPDYYTLDIHLTKQGNFKVGNYLANLVTDLQK